MCNFSSTFYRPLIAPSITGLHSTMMLLHGKLRNTIIHHDSTLEDCYQIIHQKKNHLQRSAKFPFLLYELSDEFSNLISMRISSNKSCMRSSSRRCVSADAYVMIQLGWMIFRIYCMCVVLHQCVSSCAVSGNSFWWTACDKFRICSSEHRLEMKI